MALRWRSESSHAQAVACWWAEEEEAAWLRAAGEAPTWALQPAQGGEAHAAARSGGGVGEEETTLVAHSRAVSQQQDRAVAVAVPSNLDAMIAATTFGSP